MPMDFGRKPLTIVKDGGCLDLATRIAGRKGWEVVTSL